MIPRPGSCAIADLPGTRHQGPAGSFFTSLGQDIVTTAVLEATLVTPAHVPVGQVSLTGTMEHVVLGRTSPTEVGTWETEIVALLLTGSVLGHTLTLTLDDAPTSLALLLLGGGLVTAVARNRSRSATRPRGSTRRRADT
jgi:hypothetical protein